MRLLRTTGEHLRLDTFNDERKLPKYGILSHVWLAAQEEITFDDLGKELPLEEKKGWAKLDFARRQAHDDEYEYVWIDTCCIDKSSSAELAEAINSMYRWYKLAEVCYVYLDDMPDPVICEAQDEQSQKDWDWHAFARCRWFTRGWTLQEMMAPERLRFYNSSWESVGTLAELAPRITTITGVHVEALQRQLPITSYSIAQRMSWAADRQTTKVEDQAYSLLGIFDINLPIIYGEGERAFTRLQEEILRVYSDQTIFAWLAVPYKTPRPPTGGEQHRTLDHLDILAGSPSAFKRCGRIVPIHDEDKISGRAYEVVHQGIRFTLPSRMGSYRDTNNFPRFKDYHFHLRGMDPDRLEVALECCFQNDRTHLLVMVLARKPCSVDTYVIDVPGGFVVDLVGWSSQPDKKSPVKIQDFSILKSFTVLRPAHVNPDGLRPQVDRKVIICDIGSYTFGSESNAKIALAEPVSHWNATTNSFLLPNESESFQGQLVLLYGRGNGRQFTLDISAKRRRNIWDCILTMGPKSGTGVVVYPYASTSPSALDFSEFCFIVTTIEERQLVHQKVLVLQISVHPGPKALFMVGYLGIQFLFWTLLSFSMLPITVALPVIVLSVVRREAYAEFGEVPNFVLTGSEVLALATGLPITCALSAFLLLDSKIYIKWRPLSWQAPLLLMLRCISLAMAARIYWLHFNETPLPADRSLFLITLVTATRGILLALEALSLVWSIFGLPYSAYHRNFLIPLPLINVATMVPTFLFLYPVRFLIVPWSKSACQTRSIPSSALKLITSTGVHFEESCEGLSRVANIIWPLLALAFWQLVLECTAIYQAFFFEPRSAREKEVRQNRLQKMVKIYTPHRIKYWIRRRRFITALHAREFAKQNS